MISLWRMIVQTPQGVIRLANPTQQPHGLTANFAGHDVTLSSARLLLRPFTQDDMRVALPLYQDPELKQALEGNGDAVIDLCYLERAWEYLARRGYLFAVVETASHRVIGELCLEWMNLLRAEVKPGEKVMRMPLGLWDKTCWSRGFGSEMVTVAMNYAFAVLGVDRLCAMDISPTNTRSRRLFEHCGFRLVRELEDGTLDLEITRPEWQLRQAVGQMPTVRP